MTVATVVRGTGDALVLACYGSGVTSPDRAYAALASDARAVLPGVRVELALVSDQVRKALVARGEDAPSLADVLDALAEEGVRHVAVQPVLVAEGATLAGVRAVCAVARGRFGGLSVGDPLLAGQADAVAVARELEAAHPAAPGRTVVLVGHGSEGAGDAYALLGWALGQGYLVSTLREGPETALSRLRRQSADTRSVTLVPLMLGAGAHVRRQVAGEGPQGWQAWLARSGYAVEACARGLLELDGVRELLVDHARRALAASREGGDGPC